MVPRFGPGIVGGSETLAQRLAGALQQRGWGVEVWTTTAGDERTWGDVAGGDAAHAGLEVRRFPVAVTRRPRAFHHASRLLFRLPPALRPEAAWFRLQGPYAPHLVHALGAASGATLFIPYLYYPTVYGLPAAPHPRVLVPAAHDERPLHLAAVRRAIAAADGLLYGTPEERDLVEAAHPAARDLPCAVGNVGIDAVAGDAQRFRRRLGFDAPFLLYGGRVTSGKGFNILLDAHRLVVAAGHDVRLVLAGAATAPPDPAITVTGRLDESTWRDALAAAFAVIIPSAMESLSLLALEAWNAGRPCLVNASSPVLRGQVDRSGGGVTFGSARQLAEIIGELVSSPGVAGRMGSAGQSYVRANYCWDDVVERVRSLVAVGTR